MAQKKLFKYVSSGFEKDAHANEYRLKRLEDLLSGTIRFSQPDALNDPFEMWRFREQHVEDASPALGMAPTQATLEIMGQLIAHPTESPLEAAIKARDILVRSSFDWIKPLLGSGPVADMTRGILSTQQRAFHTPLSAEEVERLKKKASEITATMNTYGILSLTQHNDNLLMWAHYAEEHRGAVFEIDISDSVFCAGFVSQAASSENINEWRDDVRYPEERALPAVSREELIASFFMKSPQWEYEHEYRIVRPLANGTNIPAKDSGGHGIYVFRLPPSSIKSLIFGARSAEGERAEPRRAIVQMIRSRPELSHIALKEARLSVSAYGLEILSPQ